MFVPYWCYGQSQIARLSSALEVKKVLQLLPPLKGECWANCQKSQQWFWTRRLFSFLSLSLSVSLTRSPSSLSIFHLRQVFSPLRSFLFARVEMSVGTKVSLSAKQTFCGLVFYPFFKHVIEILQNFQILVIVL